MWMGVLETAFEGAIRKSIVFLLRVTTNMIVPYFYITVTFTMVEYSQQPKGVYLLRIWYISYIFRCTECALCELWFCVHTHTHTHVIFPSGLVDSLSKYEIFSPQDLSVFFSEPMVFLLQTILHGVDLFLVLASILLFSETLDFSIGKYSNKTL